MAHKPTTSSSHRVRGKTEPGVQIIEAVHSREVITSIESDFDVMDRGNRSIESDSDLEQEDDHDLEDGDCIPSGSENEPGSETDESDVEIDIELSEKA